MEESQKEAVSTVKSQKKSSLLVEEIETDFLSSWKAMSVTEDDAMDFNCETVPKGRNNKFNFDKLDMDFSLDGDFSNKISSFKVDMPDLDFSSPPKKLGKTKERTGKESILGKNESKQERFTFAFDFDELGSFDLDSSLMKGEKKSDKFVDDKGFDSLDSSLMKGEKKSDKFVDDKGFDSPAKHNKNQSPRSNATATIDGIEDTDTNKLPTLEHTDTSKFQCLIGGLGNLPSIDDGSPSTSANFGNLNASDGATLSPEKERTINANETDHCSQQSDRIVSTEPNAQENIQNSSIQSVSCDDSIQETIPELQAEICSSGTEVNTNPGGEHYISVKSIAGLEYNLVDSHNLEHSSPPCVAGSQSTNSEFENLESQNGIPMGDLNGNDSVQDYTNIKDASIASVPRKMLQDTKPTNEENSAISNLLHAPLHREPKVQRLMQRTEKGIGSIYPNSLKRSEENVSQLNMTSTPQKNYSLSNNRIETVCLNPVDERRGDFKSSVAQVGNQNVETSKSLDGAVTKGVPVRLGTAKITSGSQVRSSSLPGQTIKSGTPKCINTRLISSIAPTVNPRSISVERNRVSPLKSGNKILDVTGLKVSRPIKSSHSSVQTEPKSLRHSKDNRVIHENTSPNMVSAVNAEKQGLLSPSMKRKTFEASNEDPVALYPLKRITESPSRSRKAMEAPERVEHKLVRSSENLLDSYHENFMLDIPRDSCVAELEVSLLMENDGNVEKAEACAKELDDICNMLKKKHEEAKELLVRAIVNNNNLLMLDHPIYEEKIRMVQTFANRMTSRELRT